MKRSLKFIAGIMACFMVIAVMRTDVYAANPTVGTTIQNVQFGFNPGVIVLPYGATVAKDEGGSWVLLFIDGSRAVLNSKSTRATLANGFNVLLNAEGIVYSKVINGDPIKVTYNLSNLVARVETPTTTAMYKNGSILRSKITNYGSFYTVESYNDNGAILKNESYNSVTKQLIAVDDYVKTPGMIVRTEYDALGRPISVLPYYGDTKPAF